MILGFDFIWVLLPTPLSEYKGRLECHLVEEWKQRKQNERKEEDVVLMFYLYHNVFFNVARKTKSRQCNTSTSLRLASFRDPFLRKGNSVETEETIFYLYKTSTTSVQV